MLQQIFSRPYLKRLDNIKQWQEMDVFKEESVSQHSYKVTVFCRVLLEDIFGNLNDPRVLNYKLDCVTRAMLHDWDEALILRDMSHETKYNSFNGDKLREVLNSLSEHLAVEEFREDDGRGYGQCSDASDMMIANICATTPEVKAFVKTCDWLALVFYIRREQKLGNCTLDEQWERSQEGLAASVASLVRTLEKEFEGYSLNFDVLQNLIID